MPIQSAIQTLADWISDEAHSSSEVSRSLTRLAFIDTLASMLAGCNAPSSCIARRAVAEWGRGPSVVIGTSDRLAPPWAALANGTAAHALELDDWEVPGNSHPSAVLVPALLALGDALDCDGGAIIEAYVKGFEVIARVGEAANMDHYDMGWHPTGTIAAFGAAAACSRLMGLGREATGASLGIAASMAAGYQSQAGTMTKPLHSGLAAKSGILAAQLASFGLTSADHALDGSAGFISIQAGKNASAFEQPLEKLGNPLAIEEYGLVTKRYPCCGYTHRAVDGALELQRDHRFSSEDVERITVRMPKHFTHGLRYGMPADKDQAKFSMPFCVAAAIHFGKLRLSAFTADALADPALRSLIARTDVHPYAATNPKQNFGPADPDFVEVVLRDGRRLETSVDFPVGTAARPIPPADIETKFRECAAGVLSEASSSRVLALANGIEELASIRSLTSALQVSWAISRAEPVA